MGADVLGWRDCSLQKALGRDGFLRKLKLRSYRRVIEEKVGADKRDTIRVRVDIVGRGAEELSYAGILEQLGKFEAGAPECAGCPLGGGAPLDCYRYISYPIDAVAEQAIFGFVTSQIATRDSIADQLYRDIWSQVPEDDDWYSNRGEDGMLAELDEPMVFEWQSTGGVGDEDDDETLAIDSAQILAGTFVSLENPPLVVAYSRYFFELIEWVDKQIAQQPAPVGKALEQSRTLREIRSILPMIAAAAPASISDGWQVLVDG